MRLLVSLAILPGVLILGYVYKLDKIEKEPFRLLLKLFLFGILAILPAILLEELGSLIVYGSEGEAGASVAQALIENFIVVALAEELCKFIFLKLGSWKNKAFDYRFDAIVYAVCVSMGFAVLENIFYVTDYGFWNAITRGIFAVPGHATFGICMGVYYGQAKYFASRNEVGKMNKNLRLAVLMPMLMHGFYDFALSVEAWWMVVLFYAYVIIVDICAIKKIKAYSQDDKPFHEPVEVDVNSVLAELGNIDAHSAQKGM